MADPIVPDPDGTPEQQREFYRVKYEARAAMPPELRWRDDEQHMEWLHRVASSMATPEERLAFYVREMGGYHGPMAYGMTFEGSPGDLVIEPPTP